MTIPSKRVNGVKKMKIKVFSREDISNSVSMAEAIAVVKDAFAELSAGSATVPIRAHLSVPKHDGISLFMPAYLSGSDLLGIKTVSVFPKNTDEGIPTINALVTLLDARTGQPKAVMDGTYLTAMRTGASSGAATDLLARGDARSVAIFGAGVQGRTQLEAVCEVRNIERAFVYDPNSEAAKTFASEMGILGGKIPEQVNVASTPADAVKDADVICTATTSGTPVFDDRDVKDGTHINAAGAYTPDTREIPEGTIQRASLFVDSREACWAEAGDLVIPRDKGLIKEEDIKAELGELVTGKHKGRISESEITFFESVGNAVQDVAVAGLVVEQAGNQSLGMEVSV